MLNNENIEIQNIDHLGIVAGIIDAIGLVETINELIGEEKGEKVSPGHVVFLSRSRLVGVQAPSNPPPCSPLPCLF